MTGHLIGLYGPPRSGKDTVAQFLVEEDGFTRLSFADALRDIAYALDPIVTVRREPVGVGNAEVAHFVRLREVVDALGWDTAKTQIPEIRRLLQKLGKEGVRDTLGENTWVDVVEKQAREIISDGGRVVITDTRFPNEETMVRRLDGHLLQVVRPGGSEDGHRHASESHYDTFTPDGVLENSGTLDELRDLSRSAAAIFHQFTYIKESINV